MSDLQAAEDAGSDFSIISTTTYDLPDTPMPIEIAVSGPDSGRSGRRPRGSTGPSAPSKPAWAASQACPRAA
ncbi:MAG TPA: hypothetical protein VGG25_18930 [Streptosporangiaceae bacterium]